MPRSEKSPHIRYKEKFTDPEIVQLFLGFKKSISMLKGDLTQNCIQTILKSTASKNVDILEFGPGNGVVSLEFLRHMHKKKRITSYTAVDISKELVIELEKRIHEFKQYTKKVDFVCTDAEDFVPKKIPQLIISFNSWYGISFNKITQLSQLLASDGIIAILLNTEKNTIWKLKNKFTEPTINSKDLTKWLQDHAIPFETYPITTKCAKTDYFDANGLKSTQELFLRYILRRVANPIDDVIMYLRKQPESFFNLSQELFIIRADKVTV